METLLDAGQIEQLLAALADDIVEDPIFQSGDVPLALVGIRSRGELLAQRLAVLIAERKGRAAPGEEEARGVGSVNGVAQGGRAFIDVGALDITLYRDDAGSRAAIIIPQGTEMDFAIDDRPIVLVDDVLQTGRSVRAALDALVDFGRPRLIRLAVLIDRGNREFPIAADYVGLHVTETHAAQKIIVHLKPTDAEDGVYLA